ncbi:MAG: putative signal transducing protein [Actinomycetota bacterium]
MGGDFVEIYQGSGGQFRAEMLRSLLSGSGIESLVTGAATQGYPTNVGVSGQFTIVVRAEDADRAVELLRSFEEEGAELEENE